MVTMSSRANSMYGSRPTSPGVRGSIPAGGVPYTGLSTGLYFTLNYRKMGFYNKYVYMFNE